MAALRPRVIQLFQQPGNRSRANASQARPAIAKQNRIEGLEGHKSNGFGRFITEPDNKENHYMKRTMAFLGLVLAGAAATSQLPAAQALGTTFTYQGELSEGAGGATGIYDLRFTLHDSSVGGGTLGSPVTFDNLGITNGIFTVPLDFGAGMFIGQARWIEISVRHGTNSGAFTALTPRQAITAAPYALHAANVAWTSINGIPQGVTNAAAGNHFGEVWQGANSSSGLDVRNSTGGTALTGKQGTGSGVNWTPTAGVFGDSSTGDGVVGASQFRGVWGYAVGNTENYGVYGYTASALGTGVQGRAGGAGGGTGVRGEATASTGTGVFGEALSATGVNAGVVGRSSSTQGTGVFGISTNSTGTNKGMHAVTQSAQGVGILAENTTGGVAVRANGRVQSTADSIVFIPAWAIRAERDSIWVWAAEKPTDQLQFPEIEIPADVEPGMRICQSRFPANGMANRSRSKRSRFSMK